MPPRAPPIWPSCAGPCVLAPGSWARSGGLTNPVVLWPQVNAFVEARGQSALFKELLPHVAAVVKQPPKQIKSAVKTILLELVKQKELTARGVNPSCGAGDAGGGPLPGGQGMEQAAC